MTAKLFWYYYVMIHMEYCGTFSCGFYVLNVPTLPVFCFECIARAPRAILSYIDKGDYLERYNVIIL